jgi:hypothetical protein
MRPNDLGIKPQYKNGRPQLPAAMREFDYQLYPHNRAHEMEAWHLLKDQPAQYKSL